MATDLLCGPRVTCRSCNGVLEEMLHLGDLKLNAFPAHRLELDAIPVVPLVLTLCQTCGLIQLDRSVPPEQLYREYWYRSGVNEMMVEELRDIVRAAITRRPVEKHEWVLDIGANDGTLLAMYHLQGVSVVKAAVEPARNLREVLIKNSHATLISDAFFPDPDFCAEFRGKFAIITAIAMCYDLEDPNAFFAAIYDLLAPNGIAVVQFQDFGQQLESRAFDNICHEHLEYYTLWSLMRLAAQAGLKVVDCQTRAINGGSLRVTLQRVGDVEDPRAPQSVVAQLIKEAEMGLATPDLRTGVRTATTRLKGGFLEARGHIRAVLQPWVDHGKVIDLYGASTKGNILLQVLGLGPGLIRQSIDRSPAKWGRYTITGIPIVSEADADLDPADVQVVPIWQFRPSVLDRQSHYLSQGGMLIFPLPHCEVVAERRHTPRKGA